MASYYDCIYDKLSLYGLTNCLPRRINVGVRLMDIQLLIAIVVVIFALLYIFNKIKWQFSHIEKDPKCENCPLPDEELINDKKE